MGSKNKRASGVSPSAGQPARQEVDRLIAKGWYKDAVRQAKICHRDQPTPEHHRLLERAYLLRAQELQKNGMPSAAQEVAMHLLDFGVTDTEQIEAVSALLIAVGLASRALELQGRLGSPEALERLNRHAADQAVLHPERASATPTEIREVAKKVRSALEALTAGDEPRSQELLRDVPRNSPVADWKLFAKGLAAFRRREDADAKANWDRLDPDRPASKIARTLVEVTGSALLEGSASPKLDGLERWALGEPILGPLRDLAIAVSQSLWPDAVRKLGPIRLALRRVDPSLAIRLTEALYSPLLREATDLSFSEGTNLIRSFTKAAEPLPIDPRWNRLWAQVWEGPQGHPDEAEPYWRRYIDDLESSTAIRPEDRSKAKALVLTHMGRQWADLASDFDSDDTPFPVPGKDPSRSRKLAPPAPMSQESTAARRRAAAVLEESRALYPSHRATHKALLDLYMEGGQPDRAAEVARLLLKSLPDDLETLKHLGTYHFDRDQPDKALEFMVRARALKPLDPDLLMSEWSCRAALGRQHALRGRWDEARIELATAERLLPEQSRTPNFAARKASLELKAGQPEAAATILDEVLSRLNEPAPLWLSMAIESRRFQLPPDVVDRYEAHLSNAVTKKVQGETAGALAAQLGSFLSDQIVYPGRDEHVRMVVDYLGRTTRIKYARGDLLHVCGFLELLGNQDDLIKKLANRGVKLFPDALDFPMLLGTIEMKKGPFKANFKQARKNFETALRLAEAEGKTDPKVAAIIPQIRQFLSVLNDLTGGSLGMPFPFFGGGGGRGQPPADLFEAFQEMMDEEGFDFDPDDEFDESDDYWDSTSAPLPAPRSPRKKKPKNKKKRKS
jgi:tetratricopeptide (TPR) repeat protein